MTDDTENNETKLEPYRPNLAAPAAESIGEAADGMEEFNRLLWQIAKSMWIIMVMLLGVFMLVLAYYLVEFVATL